MSAFTDYEALALAAFYTPFGPHPAVPDEMDWGARVLWWGPPGGGKTSLHRRLSRRTASRFFCLDSTMGEGALGAIPFPDAARKVAHFLKPDFMEFGDDEAGTFLIDDMSTFAPALQPYLLGCMLDKRIGSSYLPPRVRVFGAANEPIDAPNGYDLAPAVANRPCHVNLPDAPIEEWCQYLISGGRFSSLYKKSGSNGVPHVDSLKEEARVLKEWPSALAKASGLMAGFSLAKREMHRVQPKMNDPAASRAWASPRTKEFATIALASSIVHGLNEATTDTFVGGYVGEAFAVEFGAYRREQDIPDAVAFMLGQVTFEHNVYRIDRTGALLQSCCAVLANENVPKRREMTKALYTFMNGVGDDALDTVAQVVIGSLYNAQLVTNIPEAKPVLKRLRPMLDATDAKNL